MNEVVNNFLPVGDKFMLEMHLILHTVLVVHLPKTKKELKSLCRQEIQILFTETNLIKLVFNMIWLMQSKRLGKNNSIRQSFKT